MFQVMHRGSQLCLNPSNHPSIPTEGLVILPDVWTDVTAEQAAFLKAGGLEVREVSDPKPSRPTRAHQE